MIYYSNHTDYYVVSDVVCNGNKNPFAPLIANSEYTIDDIIEFNQEEEEEKKEELEEREESDEKEEEKEEQKINGQSDENNQGTEEIIICNENSPYITIKNSKCISECTILDFLNSKCILDNENIFLIQNFILNISSNLKDNSLDNILNNVTNEYKKEIILNGNKIIYQITSFI